MNPRHLRGEQTRTTARARYVGNRTDRLDDNGITAEVHYSMQRDTSSGPFSHNIGFANVPAELAAQQWGETTRMYSDGTVTPTDPEPGEELPVGNIGLSDIDLPPFDPADTGHWAIRLGEAPAKSYSNVSSLIELRLTSLDWDGPGDPRFIAGVVTGGITQGQVDGGTVARVFSFTTPDPTTGLHGLCTDDVGIAGRVSDGSWLYFWAARDAGPTRVDATVEIRRRHMPRRFEQQTLLLSSEPSDGVLWVPSLALTRPSTVIEQDEVLIYDTSRPQVNVSEGGGDVFILWGTPRIYPWVYNLPNIS